MDPWRELAETISEPDLQAVAAGFVLVACSDGELSPYEVDRFVGVIDDTKPPAPIDRHALEMSFRALADEVLRHFDEGRSHALAQIEKVRDDVRTADLVISAARVAIVADGKLEDIEEAVLRDIFVALGRDPETA